LVDVLFKNPRQEKVYVASLPTSSHFRASAGGRDLFEIARLHGAAVNATANVRLADGTELRGIEVVPAYLPYQPTEHDRRIVRATIAALGAEEHCYRSWQARLPPPLQEMVPDWWGIDCRLLSGLELPPLKELAWRIAQKDPPLGKLSQQMIADALRRFGMRIPKSRPRVG
jgi:hypothetical protein